MPRCFVLAVLLLAACGSSAPIPVTPAIVPQRGAYQATLRGYLERGCDDVLSEAPGVLDATAEIGFLDGGTVPLYGTRLWPYGPVTLAPMQIEGQPAQFWRGLDQEQGILTGGCRLRARADLRYYPENERRGGLQVDVTYESAGAGPEACLLTLPCRNVAQWAMELK